MPAVSARTTAAPALTLPGLDAQLELGHLRRAGRALRAAVDSLREYAADGADLLVLTSAWVTPEVALPLVGRRGKPGRVDMTPTSPAAFAPIEGIAIPGEAYLLRAVETGGEYGGRPPEQVLPEVLSAGRSPLTIDEGVSLLLQQPEILRDHNAFSLAGCRAGDRRVPALWTSYGAPRLGWCWDGAVHDWLGFATCAARLGVSVG